MANPVNPNTTTPILTSSPAPAIPLSSPTPGTSTSPNSTNTNNNALNSTPKTTQNQTQTPQSLSQREINQPNKNQTSEINQSPLINKTSNGNQQSLNLNAKYKQPVTNWADEDGEDVTVPQSQPNVMSATSAASTANEDDVKSKVVLESAEVVDNDAKAEELAQRFKAISMNVADMHVGELVVRFAGQTSFMSSDDERVEQIKATSFSQLHINELIKLAVTKGKGWHTMSKIQQVGLPMILSNPPTNFMGQAQAGTGKTGTFVLAALARLIPENLTEQQIANRPRALSSPGALILATTQELVTQIASEVNTLGHFVNVRARRIMSARGQDGVILDSAPWALKPGEDFAEDVVVGTVGMVKQYLNNSRGRRVRKPCIFADNMKVLVLDEADQLLAFPPFGFGEEVREVRNNILSRSPQCQVLLFSATFSNESKQLAHEFLCPYGAAGGNMFNAFSEISLQRKDMTLDKVVNFFVLVAPTEKDVASFLQRGLPPNDAIIEAAYQKKYEAILEIWGSLSRFSLGQSVIFVKTKKRAQGLAEFLRAEGVDVGQIHGDMAKDERERVFAEFKAGKRSALVATNILSRGIDNPNVTLVINVDLPEKINRDKSSQAFGDPDPETFVHRIGRSGRWTKKGASVSLICPLPEFPDLAIMKEIERTLFANEDVSRPMLQVADPSLLGDALAQQLEAMH